jgi:hypothetical protein
MSTALSPPDSSIKLWIMNSSSGEVPFDSLLLYLEETFLYLQLLALGSRLPLVGQQYIQLLVFGESYIFI